MIRQPDCQKRPREEDAHWSSDNALNGLECLIVLAVAQEAAQELMCLMQELRKLFSAHGTVKECR